MSTHKARCGRARERGTLRTKCRQIFLARAITYLILNHLRTVAFGIDPKRITVKVTVTKHPVNHADLLFLYAMAMK